MGKEGSQPAGKGKDRPIQRVAVAGATGYLGRHLCAEFARRGYALRALVRNPEQRAKVAQWCGEIMVARVTEPSELVGVLDGVDAVVSTVGITRQRDGLSYDEVEFAANRNLLNEALSAGVGSFAYTASFGGESLTHLDMIAAKERFVAQLQSAQIDSLVLRPNAFFSDLEAFVAMAATGSVPLFAEGKQQLNPISGRDLARVCVDCLEQGENEVAVGGPVVTSYKALAEHAFRAVGVPPHIVSLESWKAHAAVEVLQCFAQPEERGVLEYFLTTMSRDSVAPRYGNDSILDHLAAAGAKLQEAQEVGA